eukprot:3146865-Amphidinium_carterae.1
MAAAAPSHRRPASDAKGSDTSPPPKKSKHEDKDAFLAETVLLSPCYHSVDWHAVFASCAVSLSPSPCA